MRQKIYQMIYEQTKNQTKLTENCLVTASSICEQFSIKRNTASKYLNELVENKKLIKINSRPVYFIVKDLAEKILDQSIGFTEFKSLKELKSLNKIDVFDKVIGKEGSLKLVVEQLKSAVLYPEGLPILLHGESGTGKSMLARTTFEYCRDINLINSKAPFVVLNCAQYYNNPELLSSQLFGYKKGAFTGAEKDYPGMIETAQNGILFLDEVHRLPPEGQEKLFILMDQKKFSRVGETSSERTSNARLIFATTEDMKDNFLTTFLRRVPIICEIPNFNDRTFSERKNLVYQLFKKEADTLNTSIKVSGMVLKKMIYTKYDGNVGEIGNLIKQICAKEFANQYHKNPICIRNCSLPEPFLNRSSSVNEDRIFINESVLFSNNYEVFFSKEITRLDELANLFINNVLKTYQNVKNKQIDHKEFKEFVTKFLYQFIDQLTFNDVNTSKNLINNMIIELQEIVQTVAHSRRYSSNGNEIFMMANYLVRKSDNNNFEVNQEDIFELYEFLYKYKKTDIEFMFQLLENNLDISLNYFDKTFILLTQMINNPEEEEKVGGLIVAHGFSTASSISNVINRMLNNHIFDSIDMPLDISSEELVHKVKNYIENYNYQEGLLLLVDMGSLHHIGEKLTHSSQAPIALLNNVSTEMALWGGELIKKGENIGVIADKLTEAGKISCQLIDPVKKKENVLIISCSTGYGAALRLKELFDKVIPAESDITFAPCGFDQLKVEGSDNEIFHSNNVIGIVGTVDPKLANIPFFPMEDLFSSNGNKMLDLLEEYTNKELADYVNDNLIKNLSLNKIINSLTILDSDRIVSQIESCLSLLEQSLNYQLNNQQKFNLYVHVSCMVERLIRNQQVATFPKDDEFISNKKEIKQIIKLSFSSLEKLYNIVIPEEEIYYIYAITQNYEND